jgi:hypothetical protein
LQLTLDGLSRAKPQGTERPVAVCPITNTVCENRVDLAGLNVPTTFQLGQEAKMSRSKLLKNTRTLLAFGVLLSGMTVPLSMRNFSPSAVSVKWEGRVARPS